MSNIRQILDAQQRAVLHAIAAACPIGRILGDSRHYEEWMVDFVYTSAKIEGNSYDRIDADNLLRLGVTAGGKRYADAKMLMNLREAFSTVMRADATTSINESYLADLHQTLTGKRVAPADDTSELKALFSENERYEDPFERAIHLHCSLARLPVRYGMRTARLMQTAVLAQAGITPLFFSDSFIDEYKQVTMNRNHSCSHEAYVEFFTSTFEATAAQMLDEDLSNFVIRIRQGLVTKYQ